MKYYFKNKCLFILSILLLCITTIKVFGQDFTNPREKTLINSNWRFAFGHATDIEKDFFNGTSYFTYFAKTGYGDGAASPGFEDRSWRIVNLPHDWAVELPFDKDASHSHGYKTIGYKYPEFSIGWYRKTLFIPEDDFGKKISIQFDGIFRDAIVWVNGFYTGNEQSGYASAEYDITDYLNYGGDNVIAVRVDASIEEGWFYEGAGIYRYVWLNKTSPLHVAENGTFITSDVGKNNASVLIRAKVKNDLSSSTSFTITNTIIDNNGNEVESSTIPDLNLNTNESNTYYSKIEIDNPKLWSLENPFLYKSITKIISNDKIFDIYETSFGIRTIEFNPDKGFFLNGKNIKIKGTNNHQDHAGVGSAIPEALYEFRIKRLKEMGSNAIRTSHNPPSTEFLDACDKLGMLVLVENRLMGSNKEHLDLLERMIVQHRNHPSVILWSLGNEEWAIEGNEKGERIASSMQSFAQQIDSSRRFTVGISGGWGNGISKEIDVMGYNYLDHGNIDEHHKEFPNQPSVLTEETTTQGTRGIYIDDRSNGLMAPTDRTKNGGNIEIGWKYSVDRPFLSGLFYWTGFDYRGEPNPLVWPAVSSQYGIVDLCGFPKDPFYYLKSWWTTEPVIHITPHWNWKGNEGKIINVWVYSNCDEVELFLNDKSLGKKEMIVNEHLEWDVEYEAGVLLARGFKNGVEIISKKNETTGNPAKVNLISDRKVYHADGEDVAVITVEVNDSDGRYIPDANNEVFFSIEGPGKIIGVGNGNPASHEPDVFFENVERISIKNLKLQTVDEAEKYDEVSFDFDDSEWRAAFQNQYGEYEKDKYFIIRGMFELSDFNDETEITFYAESLSEKQKVYVNGNYIGNNENRDDPAKEFILDHSFLKKGKNIVAYAGKPFLKRHRWDEISTDPGIIKVLNPAPQWKRKVFNGLAQVIIQIDNKAGEIILTAESTNLSKGQIKLISEVDQ